MVAASGAPDILRETRSRNDKAISLQGYRNEYVMTISQGGRSPWGYNSPDTMSLMRFVSVRPHHVARKPVPGPVEAGPPSGALFLQVKAAAVCPAGLQKGDPPGKVAVYRGILPPEQGLQPPAELFPAALTCENEGATSGCRPVPCGLDL